MKYAGTPWGRGILGQERRARLDMVLGPEWGLFVWARSSHGPWSGRMTHHGEVVAELGPHSTIERFMEAVVEAARAAA